MTGEREANEERYPDLAQALACVQRNGGHRWGDPTTIDLPSGEPVVYCLDCQSCGLPATGTSLANVVEVAHALDEVDRAMVAHAANPEIEAER